jgi:hypothetical protein
MGFHRRMISDEAIRLLCEPEAPTRQALLNRGLRRLDLEAPAGYAIYDCNRMTDRAGRRCRPEQVDLPGRVMPRDRKAGEPFWTGEQRT